MANGMGKQLATGIISDYYKRGGVASGAISILDNIIRERERKRTSETETTRALLGVPGIARGEAKRRGMEYIESPEETQIATQRGLNIETTRRELAGTSISDAKTLKFRIMQAVDSDAMGLYTTKSREEYIAKAKAKMGSSWDVLPELDKQTFEEYVGAAWDNIPRKRSSAPTEKTKKPTSALTGKVGIYEFTRE